MLVSHTHCLPFVWNANFVYNFETKCANNLCDLMAEFFSLIVDANICFKSFLKFFQCTILQVFDYFLYAFFNLIIIFHPLNCANLLKFKHSSLFLKSEIMKKKTLFIRLKRVFLIPKYFFVKYSTYRALLQRYYRQFELQSYLHSVLHSIPL